MKNRGGSSVGRAEITAETQVVGSSPTPPQSPKVF